MHVEELWPLIMFALVSTLSPGGATTLATASGANFGFRRSLPLLAGIASGLASMAAAAAAGLAGLLLSEPSLQTAMKAIGSAYLVWLALRIGSGGPPHSRPKFTQPTSFAGATWMLWCNPKGWSMTLGAAASFAALASGPSELAVVLGLTFGMAAAASLCLWCLAGQLLASLLRRDWQWRAVNAFDGASPRGLNHPNVAVTSKLFRAMFGADA